MLCSCCETENRIQKDACCVTNGDISNEEDHDWSRLQCPEQNSTGSIMYLLKLIVAICFKICLDIFDIILLIGELKWIFADTTPGLREECQTDKDCHKWKGNMVCVHDHRVVESKIVGKKLILSAFLKEINPGKCQLGKMSSITYIQL